MATAQVPIANINELLDDKLYQVVGSTPASVAESLRKIDLRNNSKAGMQMIAISIFASAVNKATLETFLVDPRFSEIRPLINATLNIQGKTNMTAITLLGHCFLATDEVSAINFASEFRKKMGQKHLWAGELAAGSLSDKQREILREKKRVTNEEEARALGLGFMKHTGVIAGYLQGREVDFFGTPGQTSGSSPTSTSPGRRGSAIPSSSRSRNTMIPGSFSAANTISLQGVNNYEVPSDVMNYRKNVLNQSDSDIIASIERSSLDDFISRTRRAIATDPTGERARSSSTIGS